MLFSSINQFTKNFTKDAVLLISHYCLTLLMIISMAVFSKTTYIYTLIISTAIIMFSSTLSLCQNRTLVFGKYTIPSKANIFVLLKKGIAFMVSEHIGLLILNVDCIFVNIFLFKYRFCNVLFFCYTNFRHIYDCFYNIKFNLSVSFPYRLKKVFKIL